MRVIVLSLLLLACPLWADTHADVLSLFASMTSALANENARGFMAAFDKNMPGYDTLTTYINGLIGAAEITSNIETIKDEGDDTKRSVDLDWTMQLRSREMAGPLVEREQTVHAELVKQKKRWRIVSITPLDFFALPKFTPSK